MINMSFQESVENVVIEVGMVLYGHAVHECVSISDVVMGLWQAKELRRVADNMVQLGKEVLLAFASRIAIDCCSCQLCRRANIGIFSLNSMKF